MAEDAESNVESYKNRSKSFFNNPLRSPKDLLVNIPELPKEGPTRKPFYQTNTDLIADGIGETRRGMQRTGDRVLIGHSSEEVKNQFLGNFTRENI